MFLIRNRCNAIVAIAAQPALLCIWRAKPNLDEETTVYIKRMQLNYAKRSAVRRMLHDRYVGRPLQIVSTGRASHRQCGARAKQANKSPRYGLWGWPHSSTSSIVQGRQDGDVPQLPIRSPLALASQLRVKPESGDDTFGRLRFPILCRMLGGGKRDWCLASKCPL